jgi:RNA polymerase sigma-70 factor (ECF subfamily)
VEAEALALGRVAPRVSTDRVSTEVEFREIFAVSYRRLVVQLYGVTGDAAEAEDLVQEAFVRAAAAGKSFLAVNNPEAWVRTVAINIHRSRWRKLRNFSRIRERLAASPTELPALEERLDVIEALRLLPEGQRAVVALHYLADLEVSQVALTLGIAEGTVKSRLSRGREALARTLAEKVGDGHV